MPTTTAYTGEVLGINHAAPAAQGNRRRVMNFDVLINDGPNFRILRKDIFDRRIYNFDCERQDPFVLDCGSNIGMSILYFKHVYPEARIVAFEPDPTVLLLLKENLVRNGLTDVRVVEAALAARPGPATLHSDGKYAGSLRELPGADVSSAVRPRPVTCVRLRDYLKEPVDFLKMNIEGVEWEVLADSEDRLRQVKAMTVEYHHLPGLPRTLHKILELLDRQGFDYLLHDFDAETNPKSQPPFRLDANTEYYLLIHARQRK